MNILIVDDNADNRTTIELLLETFDSVKTVQAKDGQEAIDLAEKLHFDIIFMDIMMPHIDGIAATKAIKAIDKKCMILALSALDDDTSRKRMLASGAEDYITKPIESELFIQRMRNYLQIVELRKHELTDQDASNLFTTKIYSHRHLFNINSTESLVELWDYYLNDEGHQIDTLSDCIKMIYAYGQFVLKQGEHFHLIAEENHDNLYLTLSELTLLSDTVIKKTLLKHYPSALFILDDHILSFRLPKTPITQKVETVASEEQKYQESILSKTHFSKITASEYVAATPFSLMNKIESLEEIEDTLERLAIELDNEPFDPLISEISKTLLAYVDVIDQLLEFEHFAYALRYLAQFLDTLDASQKDEKAVKQFSTLLLHFHDDLRSWRKNIFLTQEANDIHYLDSSLLSSCLQIQAIFDKKRVHEREDSFELF